MSASDHRRRRGEPILVLRDGGHAFSPPLEGTIEWGSDKTGYSVCTEPAGARFQVRSEDFVSAPGASRPLWERRRAEDGEIVRVAAQMIVATSAQEVVEAAMVVMGFHAPPTGKLVSLREACEALNTAEKRLKAVTMLGVRNEGEAA